MKKIIFLLSLLVAVSCTKESSCNCPNNDGDNSGCNDSAPVTDDGKPDETVDDIDAEKLINDVDADSSIKDPDADKLINDADNPLVSATSKDGYEVDEKGGSKTAPNTEGITQAPKNPLIEMAIKNGIILKKADAFTISYSDGYNINFEITEEQARELLPENIRPIKLKILDNEKEPKYYISLYLAGMENSDSMERCDVFTYGIDHNDELTMYFLAGIMEFPDMAKKPGTQRDMFESIMKYMARDSRTGEAAYPHYESQDISSDKDTLKVTYKDARVELKKCEPATVDNRFSRAFVLVNSQIYRTDIDRNVNYFNQSFINAKVQEKDLNCVEVENPEKFHRMLKKENLKSIQYYGSKDKQIRWYFEM